MAEYEHILPEGSSINRPPGFNGDNYSLWKIKMKTYIKANGYRLWKIVEQGNIIPTKDSGIPKQEKEFTDEDYASMELNDKAVLMLQSALKENEFLRVSKLSTAKEIWDALEVAHEGTDNVKENRIDQLVSEFHEFSLKEGESIRDYELRFTHLMNSLAGLGKDISLKDQIGRVFNNLLKSPEWRTKATIIKETQGPSTKSLTALFGNLAEYEASVLTNEREARKDKKKSLALAAASTSDDEEEMGDGDLALMVRKFRRLYQKGRQSKGASNSWNDNPKDVPLCFECRKPGHYKSECPSLQKSKEKAKRFLGKKKAFVSSIWVNSSDEEASDEEEIANLCLVAKEVEDYYSDLEPVDNEVTLSELQDAYNDLHENFDKIVRAYQSLKKKNKILEQNLSSKSEELPKVTKLPEETTEGNPLEEPKVTSVECCANCERLTVERDRLSNALQKFTKGSEMLDIILKSQKAYKDKTGLGYKHKPKKWEEPKVKPYLNFFRKATDYASPYNFCNFCNRKGHTQSRCYAKKYGLGNTYKWVPKGTYVFKTKNQIFCKGQKAAPTKTQKPRAKMRPEAQNTLTPEVNLRPRKNGTNMEGPNKDWVPKFS